MNIITRRESGTLPEPKKEAKVRQVTGSRLFYSYWIKFAAILGLSLAMLLREWIENEEIVGLFGSTRAWSSFYNYCNYRP